MIQFLINIYIYTRFQKGFHIERYIDRYILLFSFACARVHFSFAIVQLVKKLGSTIIFFFVGFFVPIWKEHVVWVFLEKSIRPAIQNCELYDKIANYMTDFGNEENSPRSSRVMRRHRIDSGAPARAKRAWNRAPYSWNMVNLFTLGYHVIDRAYVRTCVRTYASTDCTGRVGETIKRKRGVSQACLSKSSSFI